MRPLPEFSLHDKYAFEISLGGYYIDYQKSLVELIEKIKNEENTLMFRNQLFAILQLYYDGVLSNNGERESQVSQAEVLEQLLLAGEVFADQFYRGEDVDKETIRDLMKPCESEIISAGDKGKAKVRHLGGDIHAEMIHLFGLKLPEIIKRTEPDVLGCIASGGFEPFVLARAITGIEPSVIVRYSQHKKMDKEIKIHPSAPDDYLASCITGKNVLVIDDVVEKLTTMEGVMSRFHKENPKEMYGTIVQVSMGFHEDLIKCGFLPLDQAMQRGKGEYYKSPLNLQYLGPEIPRYYSEHKNS